MLAHVADLHIGNRIYLNYNYIEGHRVQVHSTIITDSLYMYTYMYVHIDMYMYVHVHVHVHVIEHTLHGNITSSEKDNSNYIYN